MLRNEKKKCKAGMRLRVGEGRGAEG
jgi:hypothetical protein